MHAHPICTIKELKRAAKGWWYAWEKYLICTIMELKLEIAEKYIDGLAIQIVPLRNWNNGEPTPDEKRNIIQFVPLRNWNLKIQTSRVFEILSNLYH